MRVAIIVPPMDQVPPPMYGGIGRVATNLVGGLMERGNEVTLYTAKPSDLDCEIIHPLGIVEEKYEADIGLDRGREYSSRVMEDVRGKVARGHGFDVVNNHHDVNSFMEGKDQNIGSPVITTIHLPPDHPRSVLFQAFPQQYFSALTYTQRSMYPSGMNFIGVVYNSVRNDHPFSGEKRDYLFSAGRVQPFKGQKRAIEISKKSGIDLIMAGNTIDPEYFYSEIYPNIDVDLSGSVFEREEFIRNVGAYQPGGGRVTYIGEVNENERDHVMKHAKSFLFPIEGDESCPMVILEAGIVGTPIIAFDRSVVPEMVEEGISGYYGKTVDELADLTKMVDKIDPERCRDYIRERFSVDRMVDGYLELYEDVIDRKKNVVYLPVFAKA